MIISATQKVLRGGLGLLLCAWLGAMPLAAQQYPVSSSVILTIDVEQLFAQSEFGDAVSTSLASAAGELAGENARIEAELVAEELALTTQRQTMDAGAFRALADAFDAKVQRLRVEQDAKSEALSRQQEAERSRFFNAIVPILTEMGSERGAVAIFDRRDVFIAADSIDITVEAIERVNAVLEVAPIPETVPDTAEDEPQTPAPEEN